MSSLFTNLSNKPHKLFFLGGITNAMLYMVLMITHYLGVVAPAIALPVYHAYAMLFLVFTQFFTAFLFTMAPRFFATAPVPRSQYLLVFWIFNLSSLAFLFALYGAIPIVAAVGVFIAYLLVCKVFVTANFQSTVNNKYDTNWILVALAMGGLSHLLFLLSWFGVVGPASQHLSITVGFFLYLFMMVLTLSQKMIPFFTEGKVDGYKANRSRYFLETVFVLLVTRVLLEVLRLTQYGFVIDFCLAVITLWEIMKWRLPFFKVEPILWVLYLSLIWMPVGFFLSFIEGALHYFIGNSTLLFEKTALHTIAIGYFTTIAVGFGSRIILGHSGRKPKADKYTIGLFLLVQLVVLVRVLSGLSLNFAADWYVSLILISAGLWIALFLLWSLRYVKMLCEA